MNTIQNSTTEVLLRQLIIFFFTRSGIIQETVLARKKVRDAGLSPDAVETFLVTGRGLILKGEIFNRIVELCQMNRGWEEEIFQTALQKNRVCLTEEQICKLMQNEPSVGSNGSGLGKAADENLPHLNIMLQVAQSFAEALEIVQFYKDVDDDELSASSGEPRIMTATIQKYKDGEFAPADKVANQLAKTLRLEEKYKGRFLHLARIDNSKLRKKEELTPPRPWNEILEATRKLAGSTSLKAIPTLPPKEIQKAGGEVEPAPSPPEPLVETSSLPKPPSSLKEAPVLSEPPEEVLASPEPQIEDLSEKTLSEEEDVFSGGNSAEPGQSKPEIVAGQTGEPKANKASEKIPGTVTFGELARFYRGGTSQPAFAEELGVADRTSVLYYERDQIMRPDYRQQFAEKIIMARKLLSKEANDLLTAALEGKIPGRIISFGDQVKAHRGRMLQREFAKKLGITRVVLLNFERDKTKTPHLRESLARSIILLLELSKKDGDVLLLTAQKGLVFLKLTELKKGVPMDGKDARMEAEDGSVQEENVLGALIKKYRGEESQSRLAKRIGVDQTWISLFERKGLGMTPTRERIVRKLDKIFCLRPDFDREGFFDAAGIEYSGSSKPVPLNKGNGGALPDDGVAVVSEEKPIEKGLPKETLPIKNTSSILRARLSRVLGNFLAFCRENDRLSLGDVALESNIPYDTLRDIESGSIPELLLMIRVVQAYHLAEREKEAIANLYASCLEEPATLSITISPGDVCAALKAFNLRS